LLLPFLKIYLGEFDQIGELIPEKKKNDWGCHNRRHARHCPR
jgi:hypothetical protein